MGKIMLNGVTYSGTIYEAVDEESGGSVVSLPASRVIYDDTYSQLGANSAQGAIEKLQTEHIEIADKVPFRFGYNATTNQYGYFNNNSVFVPFVDSTPSGGSDISIVPMGNGKNAIAQITVDDKIYLLKADTTGMNYCGVTTGLPDISYKASPIGDLYSAAKTDTFTYKRTYLDENEEEVTEEVSLSVIKGDLIIGTSLNRWELIPTSAGNIAYIPNPNISKDILIGNLYVNGSYEPLYSQDGTAKADGESLNIIVFGKDENDKYGYYQDVEVEGETVTTFIPFGTSDISISETLTEGTNIAKITIDDTDYYIKAPSVTGVKFEKVNSYAELPNPGEDGVIYLVPKEVSTVGNIYIEYIWVSNDAGGAYEMLGDTAVKAVDIEVSAEYSSGTKVASISIDDEDADIYIPQWTGTQAEYEAQKNNIDDGTIVNITDDEVPQGEYKNLDTRVTELEKNALCRKKYISLQPGASGTFQLESPKVYLFVNAHVNWAHSREIYMLINYQPYGFISQYIGGNTNCLNFSYNTDTNLVTVSNTYSDEGVRGILIELGKTS